MGNKAAIELSAGLAPEMNPRMGRRKRNQPGMGGNPLKGLAMIKRDVRFIVGIAPGGEVVRVVPQRRHDGQQSIRA